MFTEKKIPEYKRLLEREIEHTLKSLRGHVIGSEEHKKTMDAAVTLHSLMDEDPPGVSKDTLVLVAGNLVGILLILNYEQLHPFTSRALGLVLRPR
jgi:hypothetical protein